MIAPRSLIQTLAMVALAAATSACAHSAAMRAGREAEKLDDFDRAVVEYTKAVREEPSSKDAQLALNRAKLRASAAHYQRGRRLAANSRFEEALLEYQLAAELNPTDSDVERELTATRNALRAKVAVSGQGRTALEALIDRTREMSPTGLDLPGDVKLADSLVFGDASARAVFTAIARFADINVVFDPGFRDSTISIDLRNVSLGDALATVTASTRTFYRVTAPRTITIVPDTAAKRREYEEEVVRTFYLSNADLKETIDLLRIVVDARKIAPVTGTNAFTIKDTPERVAAVSRVLGAIDKARAEVVIDVELLEVDRTRLQEYGLQIASPGQPGISGSADINREGMTLYDLRNLTQSDVFLAGLPALFYRLLKNDTNTRALASPRLRTSEGLAAQARFGERVPVPVTTFAPIATGGINQQPITSFVYENIGVNIDITPRIHHDDEVSLVLRVEVSNIAGVGFGGLPTFGNRQITTTIRLRDGETNMLAGLIRDNERTVLAGVPGLSDLPIVGRLFAHNRKETQETDILLTLTPHIIRVLDLTEADLRPFRMERDAGSPLLEAPERIAPLPKPDMPPRDQPEPLEPAVPPLPQPIRPPAPSKPIPTPPAKPIPMPKL
ncbi:MAG TPA: secretin N-terminal domain-containing protein [Vicinamibacterales bacterium]|jgi:general secretion pathway protein D|nr:secretin N-terminal domain-containing protein [Vicinamibacterales bacterium]